MAGPDMVAPLCETTGKKALPVYRDRCKSQMDCLHAAGFFRKIHLLGNWINYLTTLGKSRNSRYGKALASAKE